MSVELCPSCATPVDETAARCPRCDAILDPDIAAPPDHTPAADGSSTDGDDSSGDRTDPSLTASPRPPFTRGLWHDPRRATPAQLAWVSGIAAGIGLLLSPAGIGVVLAPVVAAVAIWCGLTSMRRTPGWKVHPAALIGFVLGVLILVAWARLVWFTIVFATAV